MELWRSNGTGLMKVDWSAKDLGCHALLVLGGESAHEAARKILLLNL